MRMLSLLAVLFVTACWSASGPEFTEAGRNPARIYTKAGTFDATAMSEPQVTYFTIPAADSAVWSRLPDALRAMGLPVNYVEPAERAAGSLNHRLIRRFGDEAVSHYLDCGSSIGGINANTHEVDLSVVAWAEPSDPGATRLRIQIEASANPLGNSASTSNCTSTGRLEAEIAQALTAPAGGRHPLQARH